MHFRPEHDPRPGGPVEWEDNWISNTFAWASARFVPEWCQTEEHWTSRTALYLFTDCPCCLFWRGLTVGAAGMFALYTALWALFAALS